ncbi:MAG: FtsX-like permease family protein [Actinomycetia bacterium]|nr:FtsX-like permease family protein [Actinomycetes bacterium]
MFRSKGRSIGAMVVLTICFMLGILMINVDVFASSKVASIKEELGTKVNLEIKSEYINEFINSKKGAEQYREDPFVFEEAVAREISKNPHIISNQSIIGGTFYSEDLISNMELMMEEFEKSDNVSFGTMTIGGEGGEEEYDPLKMFLLTGVSDAKNLDEFVDKKIELVGGDFFYEHDVEKDVCLIASDFAKANNLDIGSTIIVNGESLKVKGIYKNVMVEDASEGMMMGGGIDNIYIPLQTAQKLLGREGIINGSTFTVDSYDNVEKVVAASEEILRKEGYEDKLRVYGDTSKFEKSVSALESVKNISKVGIFSAFGAALIIILSSMFVSVRGRAREIGTLKAIGSSNSGIIKQFLVESLTICLIALFLGLILTSFANNYLVNNFILKGARESELKQQEEIFEDRTGSAGTFSSVSVSGTSDGISSDDKIEEVLGRWDMGMDLKTILYASAFSIVVSLLGTAIPAVFIARLRPAQVIKFE